MEWEARGLGTWVVREEEGPKAGHQVGTGKVDKGNSWFSRFKMGRKSAEGLEVLKAQGTGGLAFWVLKEEGGEGLDTWV